MPEPLFFALCLVACVMGARSSKPKQYIAYLKSEPEVKESE